MPIITIVILVNSTQDKTRQDKTRQDKTRQYDVYIDPLHIMIMRATKTTTMTITMTIIIQ